MNLLKRLFGKSDEPQEPVLNMADADAEWSELMKRYSSQNDGRPTIVVSIREKSVLATPAGQAYAKRRAQELADSEGWKFRWGDSTLGGKYSMFFEKIEPPPAA